MLFEHIDCQWVVSWTTDREHRCDHIDPCWLAATGQSAEAALGRGWLEAIHQDDRDRVRSELERAAKAERAFQVVARLRRKDGDFRWAMAAGGPRRAEDGAFIGYSGSIMDCHDRATAELQRESEIRALRASEQRFRAIFNHQFNCSALLAPDGRTLELSDTAARGVGVEPVEIIGKPFLDSPWWRDLPQERAACSHQIEEALSQSGPSQGEIAYRTRDGDLRYVWNTVTALRDEQGQVEYLIVEGFDITERKQAEERLRQSEECFRALAEASANVVYQMSPDWSEMRLLVGRHFIVDTLEPSKHWLQKYILPEDQLAVRSVIDEAIRTKSVFELEHRVLRADGDIGWTHSRAVPLFDAHGDITGWFGSASDVTARKQAETALRQSRDDLDRAQEVGKIGWWRLDLRRNVLTWSDENHRIFGVPKGTPLTYDSFLSRVHPDDRTYVDSQWRAGMRGALYDIEHRIMVAGEVKWVREKAYLDCEKAGDVIGGFGVTQDITERKQAELGLLKSRQQLSLALEAGQLGFWDWDVPSGQVQFGGCWASMLGYRLDEIEPDLRAWEKLVHPDEKEHVDAVLRDHLEGRSDYYECEHRMRHADGSWRWILDRGKVVERDADGRPLRAMGTHTDVTARHEAEAALRRADRRKDEFLATLAHELRNPLAPICNVVHVLKARLGADHPNSRLLDMVERQVGHLVRLVDELLEISRISRGKIELRKQNVAVADFLRHGLESNQPLIDKKGHRVSLTLPDEPLWVLGDPVRLAQIAANIVNNAAKYTPPGGRIDIAAVREGDEAVLRVRDNGVGIGAEAMPRIFDLFAQSDGQIRLSEGGLGIGLALVRKLLELHGGRIAAHSDGPGRGSEFVVRLPLGEPPSAAPAPTEKPAPARCKAAHALVIDDDHDVADSFGLLLESLGATVRKAYDGPAGVALVESFAPDLIFVDIGMPGMDGYETARRIRQRFKGRRFTLIALSGWGQEDDRRRAREAGFDLHLTKPASLEAVQNLLRAFA